MPAAHALAVMAALVAAAPSTPVRALDLKTPSLTREQMEAQLSGPERWLFVYGTQRDASTAALRARALLVARRMFGGDSGAVRADRDVPSDSIERRPVFLFGTPAENLWTRRLAPALPVTFTATGFRWFGRDYDAPGNVLHLVYPNPLDPRRFLLLVAANSPAALTGRGGGFFFGGDDWRIVRDGEIVRSGSFAQSRERPWAYDAALDRDRDRDRERFASSLIRLGAGGAEVLAPPDLANAPAVRIEATALLGRLDALGLAAPAGAPPRLTLYRSLEEKGCLTRDTRPEHLDGRAAHAALPAGRGRLDLWSVAAARLVALGAAGDAPLLEGAAAWLTGRLEGEPLERAVARLYFGGVLPTAEETAAREHGWRSPLVFTPARALLTRALFESGGAGGRRALLAALISAPPGTLDSLCRRGGVDAARVERRYAFLADSLARAGRRGLAAAQPRPWRPADGFQRGVCVAHAVSMEGGYLSGACGHELEKLRGMGANWVSLSPFGYLPSPGTPIIRPSADAGPEEETDEAVCEAAARARALGLRVWLKPHLWTRGWIGALDFGAAGWPRFFEQYRTFILHYALLAERERMDGLVVGHELVTASLGSPEPWRALIGEVRKVYHGTLTYGANWDREVEGIQFWDSLDLIGVSFYYPLGDSGSTSVPALAAGATRALKGLKALSERSGRPVLLTELGYAPCAAAPARPWEEEDGAPDVETQRACYEAVVRALEPADWVAGAYWWKWFSSGGVGGAGDRSFSPRGKPAQAVMTRALHAWEDRPVRVLARAGARAAGSK